MSTWNLARSFPRLRRFVTERVQHAIVTTWTKIALAVVLVVGASCSDASRSAWSMAEVPLAPPKEPWRGDPVVLVTVDGVRWQEIFDGTDPRFWRGPHRPGVELAPNLHALAHEHGAAIGAPGRGFMAATGPHFLSLPGYTEILTGRSPLGCRDNECDAVTIPTLLDQAHAAGARVAAFASWERIERAATSRPGAFFVSCGQTEPMDPAPGHGRYRPDRATAEAALSYFEESRPDVFYLGLGDPDEYAHRYDYPGYLSAIRAADDVLGRLRGVLARMGERGARTHVIVTVDHGRADDFANHGGFAPESARVWLVAAGPRIAARGWIPSPRDRHLADVAPTLRVVLGLRRDESPYAGRPIEELFAPPD